MRPSVVLLIVLLAAVHAPGATADAPATDPSSTVEAIDAIVVPAVDGLIATQRADGTFSDPVSGTVGSLGLPSVAFAALRQAQRTEGTATVDTAARRRMATRTLRRGTGGGELLPKLPLVALVGDPSAGLLPEDLLARLTRTASDLGRLHASGVAQRCFARADCFNNYVLADATLDMQLARSGLHATRSASRLARPDLRARAVGRLLRRLTGAHAPAPAGMRLILPGHATRRGRVLSDPGSYPLAYHALCTAMLTRAISLDPAHGNARLRAINRQALWASVALLAPNGETSYMGRGSDNVWTMAATAYAALAGARLYGRAEPELARRLRRVAQVELTALGARIGPSSATGHPLVLRHVVTGRAGRAGVDHYASATGNVGLALFWLELARDVAGEPGATGRTSPLPSEIQGASAYDETTGLHVLRRGAVWLAFKRTRTHAHDARYDLGIVRALARSGSRWRALTTMRPVGRPGTTAPSTVPRLDGRPMRVLSAVARGRGLLVHTDAGAWRMDAIGTRLAVSLPCTPRHRISTIVWLPSTGRASRSTTSIVRGPFSVRSDRPLGVEPLGARGGSSREPRLRAYRLWTDCRGRTPWRLTMHGGPIAPG